MIKARRKQKKNQQWWADDKNRTEFQPNSNKNVAAVLFCPNNGIHHIDWISDRRWIGNFLALVHRQRSHNYHSQLQNSIIPFSSVGYDFGCWSSEDFGCHHKANIFIVYKKGRDESQPCKTNEIPIDSDSWEQNNVNAKHITIANKLLCHKNEGDDYDPK